MLKLVARGARTKTAKVWRAPYVKGPLDVLSVQGIPLLTASPRDIFLGLSPRLLTRLDHPPPYHYTPVSFWAIGHRRGQQLRFGDPTTSGRFAEQPRICRCRPATSRASSLQPSHRRPRSGRRGQRAATPLSTHRQPSCLGAHYPAGASDPSRASRRSAGAAVSTSSGSSSERVHQHACLVHVASPHTSLSFLCH